MDSCSLIFNLKLLFCTCFLAIFEAFKLKEKPPLSNQADISKNKDKFHSIFLCSIWTGFPIKILLFLNLRANNNLSSIYNDRFIRNSEFEIWRRIATCLIKSLKRRKKKMPWTTLNHQSTNVYWNWIPSICTKIIVMISRS